MRRAAALFAVLLLSPVAASCEQKVASDPVEAGAKPIVSVVPSTKASVSTEPLLVAVTNPRCGADAPITTQLGEMQLVGQTLRAEGDIATADADAVVCESFKAFALCFGEMLEKEKTFGLAIHVSPDGSVATTRPIAMTLGDEALVNCVVPVANKLSFAKTSSGGKVSYALSAKKTKIVKLEIGETKITGTYASETVQRVVRSNYTLLRPCYAEALKADSTLKGTVITTLAMPLPSDGGAGVKNAGGTIKDAKMQTCVANAFSAMTFPRPDTGKVSITQTLTFSVEQ